jgi:hypothetical protein
MLLADTSGDLSPPSGLSLIGFRMRVPVHRHVLLVRSESGVTFRRKEVEERAVCLLHDTLFAESPRRSRLVSLETIQRRCDTITKTVHYVKQADQNTPQVERRTGGRRENITFETHEEAVAVRNCRTGVTYTLGCSTVKWTTPSTTAECPL